ncbi:hypothetical protein BKA61DRAFT_585756 [Leptodontidium sp. MPI-SDFR-AT-0119]|nr:hypothetical protein BKA61DRAFT_585756 [Leptodontidium sp. MPI-SDFR-AT-0119]
MNPQQPPFPWENQQYRPVVKPTHDSWNSDHGKAPRLQNPTHHYPQPPYSSHQHQHHHGGFMVPNSVSASNPLAAAFAPSSSGPMVDLTFDDPRSPTLTNILQDIAEDRGPAVQPNQDNSKKRRRPRGPVHIRISSSDWEKYKTYLKHLYMDKQHTASKIKDHMKREFQFDASEQQYKNKFVEWGFLKNIPKEGLPESITQWIVMKNEIREQDGKKTEFVYENRILPVDRIQQKARSSQFQGDMIPSDAPTPNGLTWSTPARFDSIPSPFHTNTISPHSSANLPPPSTPAPETHLPPTYNFRMNWKGYSRADLENLAIQARELKDSGNLEAAEEKYREALSGLEYILSATNDHTIAVGYELAEFFAQSNRMEEADEVLTWMSEAIVKAWGLHHSRSALHFLKVTDLYHGWSRPDDAVTVLLQAVNYLEEPPLPNNSRVEELNDDETTTGGKKYTLMTRFINPPNNSGPTDQPHNLELQLAVADAQARTQDEAAEPLLLELISQCEKFPTQFTVQNLKAHASLIMLYHDLKKHDELKFAMKKARDFFSATITRELPALASPILRAVTKLAGTFAHVRRLKAAEAMFEVIEQVVPAFLERDESDRAIDLLVDIGRIYQARGKWKYARPRFEHALAITLASRGPESMMAKRLQAALDFQSFSLSVPHGGRNDIKSALAPHDVGAFSL